MTELSLTFINFFVHFNIREIKVPPHDQLRLYIFFLVYINKLFMVYFGVINIAGSLVSYFDYLGVKSFKYPFLNIVIVFKLTRIKKHVVLF